MVEKRPSTGSRREWASVMQSLAIIVTGLPASGKTGLGIAVAKALSLPCLDKDIFLEALFDEYGVGDQDWRQKLSRQADQQFSHAALDCEAAVLISHWRPPGLERTGTPTDWVVENFENVIEVWCACAPEIAAKRFVARTRHAGHLDTHREAAEIHSWMTALAPHYPLALGPIVTASTETPTGLEPIIAEINRLIGRA